MDKNYIFWESLAEGLATGCKRTTNHKPTWRYGRADNAPLCFFLAAHVNSILNKFVRFFAVFCGRPDGGFADARVQEA
jgi:hypothetical protein